VWLWQTTWPDWLLTLLVLLFVLHTLVACVAYVGHRPRFFVLALLRAVLCVMVLLIVMQPALDRRQIQKEPGQIWVLLDNSKSMNEHDTSTKSRLTRVTEFLKTHDLSAQFPGHNVRYQDLEGALLDVNNLENIQANLGKSLITETTLGLQKRSTQEDPVAAVIVFSDGADTATPATLLNQFNDLVPIHTVLVGESEKPDLALTQMAVPPLSFVRNKIHIEVDIVLTHARMPVTNWPVYLKQNGQLIQQSLVSLDAKQNKAHVSFDITPQEMGDLILSVETPALQEESIVRNNKIEQLMRIVRDKIRVLLVVGRPSWEQRFLRFALKHNPNVDLISFFILRTPQDVQTTPQNELSLIPFPTQELFEKQLHTFDVIILQNFDYRPYQMGFLLKNIKQHVLSGGALMMLGGEESYANGAYGQTPLADILPVGLTEIDQDNSEFTPVISAVGQLHPIFKFAQDTRLAAMFFKHMPSLSGTAIVPYLQPGAQALLVHPYLKTKSGEPLPIMAVKEAGKGRTLAVTTDSLWRWHFQDQMKGGSGTVYEQWITQTLHWLMRDKEASRLKLTASVDMQSSVPKLIYQARVLGVSYQGLSGAHVQLTVTHPNQEIHEYTLRADEQGHFEHQEPIVSQGIVKAVATFVENDNEEENPIRASVLTHVITEDQESQALAANAEWLKKIAIQSKGHFSPDLSQVNTQKWRLSMMQKQRILSHQESSVWNHGLVLALVLVIYLLELVLRRHYGFDS